MMIVAIVNDAMFLYAKTIAFDRFNHKNGNSLENYLETTLASMLKLTISQ
ncbi:MAG: hypothetical protein F6K54_25960 [Okeania sp. SIO3B5]|nr:hypothetical protein [Okeania sp. SIO3B5]NEO56221.1 hypothetical protein [Okeania sp. SIO3B5]